MVIASMQLYLFLCLYLNIKSRANANMSINLYEEEYLLNTPGCAIPNIWREHPNVEALDCENSCGTRAVHVKKTSIKRNTIKFIVDEKRMKKFFRRKAYECCYKFAYQIPHDKLGYTECIPFLNGTRVHLEYEIITVTCQRQNRKTHKFYKDAFIILKTLKRRVKKIKKYSFNVLVLGMDTTSRARAIQSMTELVIYFKENNWLDYRAFQKAQKNTFPNVMNLLACKNAETYDKACEYNMSVCNHLMIWNEFKRKGYVTAYGDDHLPDLFAEYGQFKESPTDHYTRPLLLLGNKGRGNIFCTRKRQTALHVLDYALQFVKAYRDKKFFGFFWLSSNSQDPNSIPTLLQDNYIKLFEKLKNMGALNNTVIFFLGDHGVRSGDMKLPVASYYDDRLPMLYMWFPYSFRERYEAEFISLQLNQHRLTTHCDVHLTLRNILYLPDKYFQMIPPEACPQCSTLFDEKSMGTNCEDINVSERWCSCHVLEEVNPSDIDATLVPIFLLSEIRRTHPGSKIKTILRHHWYKNKYDNDIKYYVIVIHVVPGDKRYEAIIQKQNSEYKIVEEIDNIATSDNFYDTSLCRPRR